ncbi:GGDEF domain-containing protein [Alicyclobacillus fastidiosus]|uniref:GGDEF domain-containing protein n=1 Tax=Alicyclobacillus fastidiosus TaxID=392011 RepID=A0ABV5AJI1_9BACL|nr:GGDEF domain-containing protein [Alicyclobacillus fastidiosus]WEH08284.1 GGDEF domain-containing protein [Alicyclobacillus fastidiosus]
MDIKLSTLPLWMMACVAVVISLFLLVYLGNFWRLFARSYARAAILFAATCVIQSLLLNAHNGVQARLIYSFALPTVFIAQIALIDAFIVTFRLRKPHWFPSLWWIGLAFFVVSTAFHNTIYPVLQRVPNGYFFASPTSAIGFTLLKIGVFGGDFMGFIYVVGAGLRSQRYNNMRWPYAMVIVLYCLCMFNDAIIIQHHHTLYPTAWVGGFLLFIMLWRELHGHMREIYSHVNLDRLTGAYSRTFGEIYLSQCLEHQNVGLFYADIDHFKDINDKYGHRTGDLALQLMVRLVQPMMRSPNLAVRLGGDEFLFLFPNAKPDDEIHLRTHLQSLLSSMRVLAGADESAEVPLQVSLGWAYAKKGEAWSDIVHSADLSMYQAKEANKRHEQRSSP